MINNELVEIIEEQCKTAAIRATMDLKHKVKLRAVNIRLMADRPEPNIQGIIRLAIELEELTSC